MKIEITYTNDDRWLLWHESIECDADKKSEAIREWEITTFKQIQAFPDIVSIKEL